VLRHEQRRRRRVCRAMPDGAARLDAGSACPAWQFSRAIFDGAATLCAAPL
jgi:hypothetical protein